MMVKSVEITYSVTVGGVDLDYGRRVLSGEAIVWYLFSGELKIVAYWTLLTSQPLTHNAQVLITYTPQGLWNNT